MRDKVEEQALRTIHRFDMVRPGQTVLVALSGGADSLCLLAVLASLQGELGIRIEALHVDHGLRPESAEEATAVRGICSELGIPCRVERIAVTECAKQRRLSIQEAARELRYRVCYDVAQQMGAQRIAMGHTADDQAETVLMRLLRGTGGTGLSGIPPVRGALIRPLIEVWREETHAYCSRHNLAYIEDSSNRSEKYLRNRVRMQLIPHLERDYNPKLREALCRLAEVERADEEYLDAEVVERYASPALSGEDGPGWARVRASGLRQLPLALARRVARYAYGKATGRMGPPFERMEAALALSGPEARGGAVVELGANTYATRRGPWVEFHAAKALRADDE